MAIGVGVTARIHNAQEADAVEAPTRGHMAHIEVRVVRERAHITRCQPIGFTYIPYS